MIAGLGSGRGELVRAQPAAPRRQADTYLACSPSSEQLLSVIMRPAAAAAPLLIGGETGTGKTLLARTVHRRRSDMPRALYVVNCAALHDALLDDALGPLARASFDDEQTVLLDEVGELSARGQAQLVARLEARRSVAQGIRLIASTQRDLDAMAAAGQFSRALLDALSVERIVLAPLRERREEIVPLALHFLQRALAAASLSGVVVSHDLLTCIAQYAWPGNARELQNAMVESLALSDGETLGVQDLPDRVQRGALLRAMPTAPEPREPHAL